MISQSASAGVVSGELRVREIYLGKQQQLGAAAAKPMQAHLHMTVSASTPPKDTIASLLSVLCFKRSENIKTADFFSSGSPFSKIFTR